MMIKNAKNEQFRGVGVSRGVGGSKFHRPILVIDAQRARVHGQKNEKG
jgi:hypothetical protein